MERNLIELPDQIDRGVGWQYPINTSLQILCRCLSRFNSAFHESLPGFRQMFTGESNPSVRALKGRSHLEPLPRPIERVGPTYALISLPFFAMQKLPRDICFPQRGRYILRDPPGKILIGFFGQVIGLVANGITADNALVSVLAEC